MRVTTKHIMALCEGVNKLKRLGDMLADGKEYKADWRKETVGWLDESKAQAAMGLAAWAIVGALGAIAWGVLR